MVAEPEAPVPVTAPDVGSTVAAPTLLHVPPMVASLSTLTEPEQTFMVPVIFATAGTTVTTSDAAQVVGKVYSTVDVPLPTLVTRPSVPIVATAPLLLVHVPPVGESLHVEDEPKQIFGAPLMPAGAGFTVTIMVFIQPEPLA